MAKDGNVILPPAEGEAPPPMNAPAFIPPPNLGNAGSGVGLASLPPDGVPPANDAPGGPPKLSIPLETPGDGEEAPMPIVMDDSRPFQGNELEAIMHKQQTERERLEALPKKGDKPEGEPAGEKKETPDAPKPDGEKPAAAPVPEPSAFDKKNQELESSLHPNASQKTKAAFKEQAEAARLAIAAEKKRADELDAKLKALPANNGELPEATKKEIEALKAQNAELAQFRRQTSIHKDPEFVSKYVAPITKNEDRIAKLIGETGLTLADDDGNLALYQVKTPADIAALKARGITSKNLAPTIARLNRDGDSVAANRIVSLLMQNEDLGEQRDAELQAWETEGAQREEKRAVEARTQGEQFSQRMTQAQQATLAEKVKAYSKDLPFIVAPAGPVAGDAPAIAAVKTQAVKAWGEAVAKVTQVFGEFDAPGKSPEKQAELSGRLRALAVIGALTEHHIAPTIIRQNAEKDARIAALEKELAGISKAGNISRRHASEAAQSTPGKVAAVPGETTEQWMARAMQAAGQE